MITISVEDYNQISQDYYDSIINSLQFHRLTCSCGHSACLTIHGYYRRGVFLPGEILMLKVCRVKCSECGHTHTLLLSSIVPYSRISTSDQHTIIIAYETASGINSICDDNPSIDEKTSCSVVRRYSPDMKEIYVVEADGSLSPIHLLNKQENANIKRDKVRLTGGEN